MKIIIPNLVLLLALLLPATATAYNFMVDSIYYYTDNSGNNAAVISSPSSNRYSGSVSIPATVTYGGTTYSVTSISDNAFKDCTGLTSVSIPNSVVSIGWGAFCGCSKLTSITIPNSVTSIGDIAFCDCTNLTDIFIPNSVINIGEAAFGATPWYNNQQDGIVYAGFVAYNYKGIMPDGTNIALKDDTRGIASYAFYECNGLTSITIPDSVVYIGNGAFYGCKNLTSVTIGNSVSFIGNQAFMECNELKSVNINDLASWCQIDHEGWCTNPCSTAHHLFLNDEEVKDLIIPNSVTKIGSFAFDGCSSLSSVTIPESVKEVGGCAFQDCDSITRVNISNLEAWCNIIFHWLGPPEDEDMLCTNPLLCAHHLFLNGEVISELKIPNSSTRINDFAFAGSYDLKSVIIPRTVTTIGNFAFSGCSGLKSVIIPSSVTNIGDRVFSGSLINDVYCYIMDPSIVSLGYEVFYECSNYYGNRTLHVPNGTLDAYQANHEWIRCFSSIVEMDNHLEMPDTSLLYWETVTIPVVLCNDRNILAFQTDIVLPEGFSIVANEEDEYLITPSNRLSGDHVMMASDYENGVVRVVCYTPESQPIEGYNGDLFYITVKVPENAVGEYPIILRNSRLTTEDYTELRIPDASATINVKAYILGDANNSRSVTVTDIVVTAQYMLGRNPQPFIYDAADMNGDGDVSVTDIMLIAYMLQHPSLNAPLRVPGQTANNDRMSADAISLIPGETRTINIMLDNDLDYSAFQLDLTLPEGLTASNFALTDRAGGHAFDVSEIDDSKLRALCYSPELETINGHEGALLTFDVTAMAQVTGNIIVDAIELVTDGCQTVEMGAFNIQVNNSSAVNEVVNGKAVARVEYFNVAGQQIAMPTSGITIIVTTYTDGTRSTTKLHL